MPLCSRGDWRVPRDLTLRFASGSGLDLRSIPSRVRDQREVGADPDGAPVIGLHCASKLFEDFAGFSFAQNFGQPFLEALTNRIQGGPVIAWDEEHMLRGFSATAELKPFVTLAGAGHSLMEFAQRRVELGFPCRSPLFQFAGWGFAFSLTRYAINRPFAR